MEEFLMLKPAVQNLIYLRVRIQFWLHVLMIVLNIFFTPNGCFFSQHNEFSKLYFILSWAKTTSLKPNRVIFSDYFL